MTSFGFIVATCIRTYDHMKSLEACIQSILSFYSAQQLVIIVDFTSDTSMIQQMKDLFPSVLFETDVPKVPADMLMLYFFKKHHYFDLAITLQDSMIVLEPFDVEHVSDIEYLWHFTNHRIHWSVITEPQTEFNIANHIRVHDDLNLYCIQNLIDNHAFKEYCIQIYPQKEKWSGSFGSLSLITYNSLIKLDNATGIIDLMLKMNSNRRRRAIESIFALACQFYLKKEIHSSYDDLYYDGLSGGHGLTSKRIKKITFDRQ